MPTITSEVVSGELIGTNKSYSVSLRLTIQETWSNQSDRPVARAILKAEPLSLSGVEEGSYTLRFLFGGKYEEQTVRIHYGFMLAD